MAERDKGESLQVHTPVVLLAAAGIFAMMAAVAFGFTLLFPNRIGVSFVPRQAFPLPGAVTDEHQRRLNLEARQRRELAGAGGRLPITAAMAGIAARGGRAFEPLPP